MHVWIWPSGNEPELEPAAGPGPGWQRVGELTADAAPDIAEAIRRRLHAPGGRTPPSVAGYISGYADHEWVQSLQTTPPEKFVVAFGPIGHVGDVYLVSRAPAELAAPSGRLPEPHPGALNRPQYFGIRIIREEGVLLDRHN